MLKKIFAILVCSILLIIFPLAISSLMAGWLMSSDAVARLLHCCSVIYYRMIVHLRLNNFLEQEKPGPEDLAKIRTASAEMREQYRSWMRSYWAWCIFSGGYLFSVIREGMYALRSAWVYLMGLWQKVESKRFIIQMNTDATAPCYRELFRFLKKYFGIYRILPGIFAIDNFGIMHMQIQVQERKKDNLSYADLSKSLQLMLINALAHTDDLLNIPPGYWNENTVYFPDVERHLENEKLVALIALSQEGALHIKNMQEQEQVSGKLEERL